MFTVEGVCPECVSPVCHVCLCVVCLCLCLVCVSCLLEGPFLGVSDQQR